MRHVLFVAFHFPPEASSSGVLRTLKYVRYLPEFSWRTSVLTLDPSAYETCDASLEAQVPPQTRIVRTAYRNTKRHLSWRGRYPALLAVPDTWIGWLPYAVAAGRRLLHDDPVDLVYSTSPHATAHLIAGRLASVARLPWVADFRDPWHEDVPEPGAPRGPVYRFANRWLEQRVVRAADAVVASTRQLQALLQERYPKQGSLKIRSILNGYDEADFGQPQPPLPRSQQVLRIVHAGSINAEFRDPRPLFAALARCIAAGALEPDRCEIRFLGAGPYADAPALREAIVQAGLENSVTFVPRLPYAMSLRELATADVLLLLQASDDTVGLVPAKLYEYLRAQKPTLALVRAGAVDDVLACVGGGWSVDPAHSGALDAIIARLVSDWRSGTLSKRVANRGALARFDRRNLTGELAALFDQLLRQRAFPAE